MDAVVDEDLGVSRRGGADVVALNDGSGVVIRDDAVAVGADGVDDVARSGPRPPIVLLFPLIWIPTFTRSRPPVPAALVPM